MSSKMKNMETILLLGSLVLIFAGIIAFFSKQASIFNVALILIISIIFFIISNICEERLNDNKKSNIYYYLGLVFIILAYLDIGFLGLFGNFFSLKGEGASLFLSSIAILMGILSLITYIKTKNFNYIYFMYICIIMMISFLLIYLKLDYILLLIGLNIIIFILAIFKKNNLFKITLSFLIFISIITSFIKLLFAYNFEYLIILGLITLIETIYLLFSNKKYIKLFGMLLEFLSLMFIFKLLDLSLNMNITGILIVFLIESIELIIANFNLLSNKTMLIINKIFNNYFIIFILYKMVNLNYILPTIIVLIIYLITNITIIKRYKEDNYEKLLLPFKIVISSYVILSILPLNLNTIYVDLIINFIILGIYYYFKNNNTLKKSFLVMLTLLIIKIIFNSDINLFGYFIYVIIMAIDYYLIIYLSNLKNNFMGKLIYTLLVIFMTFNSVLNQAYGIELILIILLLSLFAYLFKDNKYNFSISLYAFMYLLFNYIDKIFVCESIKIILSTCILYAIIYIYSETIFNKTSDKDNFISIILIFWYLYILTNSEVIIFVLISNLVLMLIGIKKPEYKTIFKVGIIFTIISLLKLLNHYVKFNVSIVLFLIGILILCIIIYMMIKYKGSPEEIKDKSSNYSLNYCPHCGQKIEKIGNYCSKCGGKL